MEGEIDDAVKGEGSLLQRLADYVERVKSKNPPAVIEYMLKTDEPFRLICESLKVVEACVEFIAEDY